MTRGRSLLPVIFTILISLPMPATAGWFGTETTREKSGLDLEHGYDRNTVVTLNGKVTSIDTAPESGPVIAIIQHGKETTTLVLGPKEYWQSNGLKLQPDDNVTVRGSKAQGRDGKNYLIVASIVTPANGTEVTLRNDAGRPAWSGGNRHGQQRSAPMRQFRGGRAR